MTNNPLQRSGKQCVSVSLDELLHLSGYVKKLSLNSLRTKSSQFGQHSSHLLARGMEFSESRQYQSGDDIRNIDWRVTARTGKAHTKLFSAEKERPVLLGVDMRPSMFFATQGVFKSIQGALITATMAWHVAQKGDRLGGIIFDDQQIQEFRPALGKQGVLPFLNGLSDHTSWPRKDHFHRTSDGNSLDKAIESLGRLAAPGSLVLLVSDFRQLTPFAYNQLLRIARHSDLYLCFVYDPIEAALPRNGFYPFTDGMNERLVNTYDRSNVEKYAQQFTERKAKVASLAQHSRVRFMECRSDESSLDVLMRCFR